MDGHPAPQDWAMPETSVRGLVGQMLSLGMCLTCRSLGVAEHFGSHPSRVTVCHPPGATSQGQDAGVEALLSRWGGSYGLINISGV